MPLISNPKGIEVRDVDYGIANNFGNYIEINRHLRNYPTLFVPIMRHELAHTDAVWSWEDFKLDFLDTTDTNRWDLVRFMFKHPKSFTQFLPIYWTRKKGFVYDINMMIMYLIMCFVFIGTIYLGVNL